MLTIAHTQATRSTYTDDLHGSDDRLYFGSDSQMDLAVSWGGRQRSFDSLGDQYLIIEACENPV